MRQLDYPDISVPTTPRAGKYRSARLREAISRLPTDECVEWTGPLAEDGYGRANYNGHRTAAHRAVWTEVVGRIPDGMVLDHRECRNPPCVNPAHLEPVTQRVNVIERGTRSGIGPTANAAKTHCLRGHEFTPENTRVYVRSPVETQRVCLTCEAEKNRRNYLKRKAKK